MKSSSTLTAAFLLIAARGLHAQGSLTPPPGTPAPTMKSLQEIWDRMNTLEAQNTALQTQNTQLANLIQRTAPATTQYVWERSTIDPSGGSTSSLAFAPNGHPAVAYRSADLKLKYAAFNGTTWQITIIDSFPSKAAYCSLAFSANGQPAIAYTDDIDQDLLYASFDGTNWLVEGIDKPGDVGRYCTLKFLPGGQPAIAYYDATNGDLKYITHDGFSWVSEVVSSAGDVGAGASLAISPTGLPAISYYDTTNARFYFALNNGSSWTFTSPGPTVNGTNQTSIAFSPAGVLSTASHETAGSTLVFLGITQTPFGVSGGSLGINAPGRASLAFTSGGQPYIGYRSTGDDPSVTTRKPDGSWQTTVLEQETLPMAGVGEPSLAIAPNLQPAASYSTGERGLVYAIMNPFAAP